MSCLKISQVLSTNKFGQLVVEQNGIETTFQCGVKFKEGYSPSCPTPWQDPLGDCIIVSSCCPDDSKTITLNPECVEGVDTKDELC